jgi:hypothetical protein
MSTWQWQLGRRRRRRRKVASNEWEERQLGNERGVIIGVTRQQGDE